jgi:TetR/AcrR family transcriptional repressor of nem operon
MKVSKLQAAENRERVLDVAGKLFRERGFDGIGLADLMKQAGLTHGGFYGQFGSKENLMIEAISRAFEENIDRWSLVAKQAERKESGSALKAITTAYLSKIHRDQPNIGCVMASLGVDVARQSPTVRDHLTSGFRAFVGSMTRLFPNKTAEIQQEKALALTASLVGGLILARAVDDEALSEEILKAVAKSILETPEN